LTKKKIPVVFFLLQKEGTTHEPKKSNMAGLAQIVKLIPAKKHRFSCNQIQISNQQFPE
jgi:hypothetical protein